MPRTAEQKAADEALREAIWNVIKTMPSDEEGTPAEGSGVLTKFMVIAVQVAFNEDGDAEDSTSLLYSDGRVLGYEAEGMLAQANRIFQTSKFTRNAGYGEEE